MARSSSATRKPVGMTLIELMIVVVIIGIVTGLVVSRVDYEKYQVNGDMQNVGVALISAQRQAIASQHNVIVMFDETNRTIKIGDDVNSDRNISGGSERIRAVPLGDRVVFGFGLAPTRANQPNAVNFNRTINGYPALIFYRNGSASFSGGFYIASMRAQAGDTAHRNEVRAVEIERTTGRVQWFRYDGNGWQRKF